MSELQTKIIAAQNKCNFLKVIYEIEIPNIKSTEDVSIIRLENSIEIKIIANKTAYFKVIPVNLNLMGYEILKEKLILELDSKN